MVCDELNAQLGAYLDRELEDGLAAQVERHLAACADCREREERLRALRRAIRVHLPVFQAPAELTERIRSGFRAQGVALPLRRIQPWKWVAAAAAAILVLTTWRVTTIRGAGEGVGLPQEMVASHVRSLMADHLTDVASSDHHTVRPWFDGRLDYAPPVADLAAAGYPLRGGRLDYLDGRSVAALVYGAGLHVIYLFVWPSPGVRAGPVQLTTRQGYNLVHWTDRKSTRLNSSHIQKSRMPSSA